LLREQGWEVVELVFDLDRASSREAVYAQAVKAAPGYDLVLFGEWELLKRSANQSDHWQESLIAALLKNGRQVLMVVWRDPGAILRVPQVPTCLVAYGTTSAQVKAVAKVLTGQAMPQGHLPLTLVLPGH
jgi:beta-N-acetylhexosaminidase